MEKLVPVKIAGKGRLRADLLVVACLEGKRAPVQGLPEEIRPAVERMASRRGWNGREQQQVESELAGGSIRALALHGLGQAEELDHRKVKEWVERLAEQARINGLQRLVVALPRHPETYGEAAAERLCRLFALANYRFDRYSPEATAKEFPIQGVELIPPSGEEGTYRRILPVASAAAEAVAWTRDLGNAPGNEATPQWMEEQARELARRYGMKIRVLGPKELARKGMEGILAVGAGSHNEPRLVRMEWEGGRPVVSVVGKGVTFDTGGISIKPAKDMDEMKYDKCGACAALGIARATASLNLPLRLRVYIPLVENMLDGRSYRPGDIIRCYNGKTVEIINTDAEGRLILADALAWAVEEKPDAVLEYSTLTGACVVALGLTGAGLFSPDDELRSQLLAAAADSGERLWPLPLWPEFVEEMKGEHADLRNSAGRWGGACTAAAFLAQFLKPFRRWAHIDIAGPAYIPENDQGPKGATGYGVPLALNWLRRQTR